MDFTIAKLFLAEDQQCQVEQSPLLPFPPISSKKLFPRSCWSGEGGRGRIGPALGPEGPEAAPSPRMRVQRMWKLWEESSGVKEAELYKMKRCVIPTMTLNFPWHSSFSSYIPSFCTWVGSFLIKLIICLVFLFSLFNSLSACNHPGKFAKVRQCQSWFDSWPNSILFCPCTEDVILFSFSGNSITHIFDKIQPRTIQPQIPRSEWGSQQLS